MTRRIALTLAAPLLPIALWAPAGVRAQVMMPEPPPTIVVTAEAVYDAEPDIVEITLSVVTEGKQSQSAVEENSRKAARVHEALRQIGLTKDEISTGRFSVQPIYRYEGRPRISGFRVANTVNVRTDRLALAGDVLQAAIDAGANEVQDVSFTLSDHKAARSIAIREAVQSARAEAHAAAAAAGVTITGVRRININQQYNRPQPYRAMAAEVLARSDAPPPPIEAGDVSVLANVTVEFAIADKPARNNNNNNE